MVLADTNRKVASPNSYDEVPYSSYPYSRTHPDRLATIARLFGMTPKPVTGARVLELGSASGGNLIPMAEQLPGARFVGVDLSRRQIAEGQAAIEELGLPNIELQHADILAIDESWGEFDYILCHGVFSWVPTQVQDKILAICRNNLSPQGIAYVSYNTYPGWHLRESVRHMMRYHVAQFAGAQQRTGQAGALVDFLASASRKKDDPYGLLLERELKILASMPADYLFHEHLEEHNQPCYFHEFAARLGAHRLQYLGEVDVGQMLTQGFDPDVADTLSRISPDIIRMEQYMDFVRNRQFRQTLVCHADISVRREVGPEAVEGLSVAFPARPTEIPVDLAAGVSFGFQSTSGVTVASALPLTKAALSLAARRFPEGYTFDVLYESALGLLANAGVEGPDPAEGRRQLAGDLLQCFFGGGIELRTWLPAVCRMPSERPTASAYARWQASRMAFATNRQHERVKLDVATGHIVQMLDGHRDLESLVEGLAERVADGTLRLSRDDVKIVEPAVVQEAIRELLTGALRSLAANALLVD